MTETFRDTSFDKILSKLKFLSCFSNWEGKIGNTKICPMVDISISPSQSATVFVVIHSSIDDLKNHSFSFFDFTNLGVQGAEWLYSTLVNSTLVG